LTTLAIDLAVLAIVAFCGWRGYKNGLIRGVFGVVTLIVSLFIANITAMAYSREFTQMLKPFVSGVVESTFSDMRDEGLEYDPGAHEHENQSEEFGKAYTALRMIGLPESAAVRVAEATLEPESKEDSEDNGDEVIDEVVDETAINSEESGTQVAFSDLIADKLSDILAYVAVFAVAFILLAIIFSVMGNIISFVFSLPGLKLVDIIAGSALGLVKGLIIVYALTSVIRYFGLLVPQTIEDTSILKHFINNNPIADLLGI